MTHYCRVPPGGTSCAASSTLRADAANEPDEQHGLRRAAGLRGRQHRDRDDAPLLRRLPAGAERRRRSIYVSTDGGKTFGLARRSSATQDIAGDAISRARRAALDDLGRRHRRHLLPGAHARARSRRRARTSATPARRSRTAARSALIDANTPIATFDDLDTTFWRRYDGSGSYNDVANWTPTATVGPGDGRDARVRPERAYGSSTAIGDARRHGRYVARAVHGRGLRQRRSTCRRDGRPDLRRLLPGPGRPPPRRLAATATARWCTAGPTTRTSYGPITTAGRRRRSTSSTSRSRPARTANGWVVWDANGDRDRVRAAALQVAPDPPTLGKTVTVNVVKGEVLHQAARRAAAGRASQKGAGFVPLTEARSIPVGSILDTTRGHGGARSARNKGGQEAVGHSSAPASSRCSSRARRRRRA